MILSSSHYISHSSVQMAFKNTSTVHWYNTFIFVTQKDKLKININVSPSTKSVWSGNGKKDWK